MRWRLRATGPPPAMHRMRNLAPRLLAPRIAAQLNSDVASHRCALRLTLYLSLQRELVHP